MTPSKIISAHLTLNLSYYGGGHHRLKILTEYNSFPDLKIMLISLGHTEGFELENDDGDTIFALSHADQSIVKKIMRLVRLIREKNIHVLHAYGAQCQFIAGICGRITGVPVAAWEIGQTKYGSQKAIWVDRITEFLVKKRVCNSTATRKAIQKAIYCTISSKWSVVYPGVPDRPFFSDPSIRKYIRREYHLLPEETALVTIGGFIEIRDHITTLKAFKTLVEEGENLKLFLIGDGPLREKLEHFVNQHGLSSHVIFTGYVRDASAILPGMDIYINGAYEEGFGFATVEAMLAGLPVIAADAGANPEVIENKKTGILIPPCEVKSLKDAVAMVIFQKELSNHLRITSRDTAKKRFSPEQFSKDHYHLCKELMGNHVENN